MPKLKIFLTYHKKTPLYKSEVFEPIQVGTALSANDLGILKDNFGENISNLNPYFCELTGYYWVLKNYIDNSQEDYIGFAHYRRLIDLTSVTVDQSPAIYGLNYTNSLKVMESFKQYDLAEFCKPYDIILPCKAYIYKDTINPVLKDTESPISMYQQFKTEYNSDLLDVLKSVIVEKYPDFLDGLNTTFNSNCAYFYNIYVMKKEILKEFLNWSFDILFSIGDKIGGWKNTNNLRMAGFIGERLINIWINSTEYKKLNIGHCPIYMIDFEAEYISNANTFNFIKRYDLEIEELKHLLEMSSEKFIVCSSIFELYIKINDTNNALLYFEKSIQYATTTDEIRALINICVKYDLMKEKILVLYKRAMEIEPANKDIARSLLNYANRTHNIENVKLAWDYMLNIGLDDVETKDYEHFVKCYNLVHGIS